MTITHDFHLDHNDAGKDSFDQFIEELAQQEQPEQCSIDNPECEACGS